MPVNDFLCSCGFYEDTVIYKVGVHPPCPDCGQTLKPDPKAPRSIGIRGSGYGSFTPINMGVLGMCDTKEKYDRACAVIHQRYPNSRIDITTESEGQKAARLDEHKHAQAADRRSRGMDPNAIAQVNAERKAAARHGDLTDKVHTLSAAQLISPTNNPTSVTAPKLAGKATVLSGAAGGA